MKRTSLASALIAFTLTLAADVRADPPDKARAKEAYDRGLAAHKRGNLRAAAEEFARADSFAPSPVALQAALDAAIEADDVALGAELLERSKREPAPPGLASSITAAHLKFSGRAGRVRILCPQGSTCTAKVDERPVDVDKVVWAKTGQRTVIVQVDGEAQTKVVDVGGDQVVDVSPSAKGGGAKVAKAAEPPTPTEPPPDEAPRERRDEGLAPVFFFAGVGLTVVLAGVTTYFALDTASQHDKFDELGCGQANFTDCESLKSKGESSQTWTNVGLVATGLSAVGTAIVGVALTNWKGPLVGITPDGGQATWRVAF